MGYLGLDRQDCIHNAERGKSPPMQTASRNQVVLHSNYIVLELFLFVSAHNCFGVAQVALTELIKVPQSLKMVGLVFRHGAQTDR